MRRYLVVANQTLGAEQLLAGVRTCAAQGACEFFVLVPASPPRGGFTWTESEAALIARDRLDRALTRFQDVGIRVEGRIGDVDAFAAVKDVLQERVFDEVIISTLPQRRSQRKDLASQVEDSFRLPVTHITSPSEPAPSADALKKVPLCRPCRSVGSRPWPERASSATIAMGR